MSHFKAGIQPARKEGQKAKGKRNWRAAVRTARVFFLLCALESPVDLYFGVKDMAAVEIMERELGRLVFHEFNMTKGRDVAQNIKRKTQENVHSGRAQF